jgi:arylsulfatase A
MARAISALALWLSWSVAAAAPPNIVLLLADDFGFESVGAYGSLTYATPHLDQMAAAGMRFQHAYATPLCRPTRTLLMTGKYNFRVGKRFKGERTLAHLLKEAGYVTLIAGKWQLWAGPGQTPAEAGFDESIVTPAGESPQAYWAPVFAVNGVLRQYDRQTFGPDVLATYVNDFIVRHQHRPFFVYYPLHLAHAPYVPTPDVPDAATQAEQRIAMVSYTDKVVGQVLEHLEHLGLRHRTLVLFTGDNGSTDVVRGAQLRTPDGPITVQGQKGHPTEMGTHVPLLVRWPGTVPPGVVNPNPVDFSAFLPTLAAVAGVPPPAGIDGVSLLDELQGHSGTPRGWVYTYYDPERRPDDAYEFNRLASEWVQDTRYKLYRVHHCAPATLLVDVLADREERHPLLAGHGTPEQEQARTRLQAIMRGIRPESSALPRSCGAPGLLRE